ncbi:acyl-CoA dehydrogenase family protein [Hyphomicrobiales bacterium FT118]|uniref:Acyl-CoA dehydrogenase family protein n=1 Tax=Futiania mangrovi TaxID=2959716 RepID=A0A9J6PGM6_9PROT|nr:acyl-CoA dehydrogenase family protein [Futiania mangrovii]MCP1336955.1 acyl-CoA dehydrogenase family protein [Futiania mangrovii]
MIDFSMTDRQRELKERVTAFIDETVIPYEKDARATSHGPTDELRVELNALAKEAGLFAPHVSEEYGGLGLGHVDRAIVFEAAGRSPLGPVALHCAAPDEGNMHLLEKVATHAQKEKYLLPLASGAVRSCFAMTERGGAGADPSDMKTVATPDGAGGYIINGSKWLITGADGAGFSIIMATVDDPKGKSGPTMFLTPLPAEGVKLDRLMDTMDSSFTGGHGEIVYENLRVGPDAVLGEVGEGFRYAQVRLAPARLTHCMRWLGGATRAHEIATEYARQRHAFGKPIGEHEGVGFMLADNEIDIAQSRLTIWHTAWLLDQGEHARHESSMAKVAVSEALFRIVDRCVQTLGGLGMSRETVVEQLFREIRGFRIYDGPSEVHRWAIAKRVMRANRT